MLLSQKGIRDIVWWHENIMSSENRKQGKKTPSRIYSNASKSGLGTTSANNKTGGSFSFQENKYHINAKELLAAKFALGKGNLILCRMSQS